MDAALILGPEEKGGDDFETIASELILGINEKKPDIVAKALQAFFALCDASPHEEYSEGE